LNEAFAVQVNVHGGAIAPLCIGGGMGTAMVIEAA
jgi:hypothetical protein